MEFSILIPFPRNSQLAKRFAFLAIFWYFGVGFVANEKSMFLTHLRRKKLHFERNILNFQFRKKRQRIQPNNFDYLSAVYFATTTNKPWSMSTNHRFNNDQ